MYVTCVELMVLPMEPHVVGEKLVDVSIIIIVRIIIIIL